MSFFKFSSCWAFAGIAALEAAVFMKTGKSVSLSEQQLVDCTYRSSGHDGCQGGWMYTAYDYLKTSIGSITQSAYPVRINSKFMRIMNLCIYFLYFFKSMSREVRPHGVHHVEQIHWARQLLDTRP
jgi:hypothetical protein